MSLQQIDQWILWFSCILLTLTSYQVCCEDLDQGGTQTTYSPSVTQGNTFTNACPFNITVADSTRERVCGISSASTDTIVGGEEAQRGAYPWIAGLAYGKPSGSNPVFRCGGTLITQRHVLTLAKCITSDLYMVRLGANILNARNQSGARDVQIERKVVYPSSAWKTVEIDIALLKLSEHVQVTAHIRPICLPTSEPLESLEFTGCKPFVAGWGIESFRGPTSNILRDAQVSIVKKDICGAYYRQEVPHIWYICTENGYGDDCRGNVGGPLMLPVPSSDGNRFYFHLIGIAAYGYEGPGVYTRVVPFIVWIQSELNL